MCTHTMHLFMTYYQQMFYLLPILYTYIPDCIKISLTKKDFELKILGGPGLEHGDRVPGGKESKKKKKEKVKRF